jgi:hypothetical protein
MRETTQPPSHSIFISYMYAISVPCPEMPSSAFNWLNNAPCSSNPHSQSVYHTRNSDERTRFLSKHFHAELPFFTSSLAQCDSNDPRTTPPVPYSSPFSNMTREELAKEKARVQAEIDRSQGCPSCLFVGMATSFGLAAYFTHLAVEDLPKVSITTILQQPRRLPYLGIAAVWVGVGAYRWHLG